MTALAALAAPSPDRDRPRPGHGGQPREAMLAGKRQRDHDRAAPLAAAIGSSRRKARLKMSWLGMPCFRVKKRRSRGSLAAPNSAISEQFCAPHKLAAKAITKSSVKSCWDVQSRGLRTWIRQIRKDYMKPFHLSLLTFQKTFQNLFPTQAQVVHYSCAIPLPHRGCGSVWLERWPVTPEAAGSRPITPAICIPIAYRYWRLPD